MAKSPSHKFGQIIGDLLESVMEVYLVPIAKQYDLYLDKKEPRKARNNKKEVIWTDIKGNNHKLDFVFERNGTQTQVGDPVAFIEIAWRRYKKHSKNKAQEIQGAITPLVEKYSQFSPFYGCTIAGEFTKPSIDQLISHGFKVVYFPYETILNAFNEVGVDARWEEDTPTEELQKKVEKYEALNQKEIAKIVDHLLESNKEELENFSKQLCDSIIRKVEKVRVYSLHGVLKEVNSIEEAIQYVTKYDEQSSQVPILKYEIKIVYNNGDQIEAEFKDRSLAIKFLRDYLV